MSPPPPPSSLSWGVAAAAAVAAGRRHHRRGVAIIVAVNADAGRCRCRGGVSSDDAGNGGPSSVRDDGGSRRRRRRRRTTLGGVAVVVSGEHQRWQGGAYLSQPSSLDGAGAEVGMAPLWMLELGGWPLLLSGWVGWPSALMLGVIVVVGWLSSSLLLLLLLVIIVAGAGVIGVVDAAGVVVGDARRCGWGLVAVVDAGGCRSQLLVVELVMVRTRGRCCRCNHNASKYIFLSPVPTTTTLMAMTGK